jgi:hypothetical protein
MTVELHYGREFAHGRVRHPLSLDLVVRHLARLLIAAIARGLSALPARIGFLFRRVPMSRTRSAPLSGGWSLVGIRRTVAASSEKMGRPGGISAVVVGLPSPDAPE